MWVVGSRHQTTHTQTHTQQLPSYRQKRLTTTPRERDPTSLFQKRCPKPLTTDAMHKSTARSRSHSPTFWHARAGGLLFPLARARNSLTHRPTVCVGPRARRLSPYGNRCKRVSFYLRHKCTTSHTRSTHTVALHTQILPSGCGKLHKRHTGQLQTHDSDKPGP